MLEVLSRVFRGCSGFMVNVKGGFEVLKIRTFGFLVEIARVAGSLSCFRYLKE